LHLLTTQADEWGLGPPWDVAVFGAAHGMYAAGFLAAITRAGPVENLVFSNYFEPVNEGAISVMPFNVSLTPVGEVMAMYVGRFRFESNVSKAFFARE